MWADLQRGLFWGHYTPDRLNAALAEVQRDEEGDERAGDLAPGGGVQAEPEDPEDVDLDLPLSCLRSAGAFSSAPSSCGGRPLVPRQRALTPSRVGGRPASRARAAAVVECCSPEGSRTEVGKKWSVSAGWAAGRTSPAPHPGGRPARRRQEVMEALPSSARASLHRRPASVCGAASARTQPTAMPRASAVAAHRESLGPSPLPSGAGVQTESSNLAHPAADKPDATVPSPSPTLGFTWDTVASSDAPVPLPRCRGRTDTDLSSEARVEKTSAVAHEPTTAGASKAAKPPRKDVSRLLQRLTTHGDVAVPEQPSAPRSAARRPAGAWRRPRQVPEAQMPAATVETIRQMICGAGPAGPSRLPPEKQTSHVSDDIAKGARELRSWERERVAAAFKELVAASDDRKERAESAVVPFSDVARRLRGLLSSAHIQRLCSYFGFPKRMRLDSYAKRVALLVTSSQEKRLRICFGLLDVDGDAVLGPRDVFAALSSSKGHPGGVSEVLDLRFEESGPLGLDFEDVDVASAKPIRDVTGVVPGSPAEDKGLQPGDRLTHIDGVAVETLVPQEVRHRLGTPARPLRLRFERRGKPSGGGGGVFAFSDFERMLEALRARHRLTTRISVTLVGAKGLRQADAGGSKSDPYCVLGVQGNSSLKFRTKVVSDCLDPMWNEEKLVADYSLGDTLTFTVWDRDVGASDELLGRAALPCRRFVDGGFDGELKLLDAGRGIHATLHVKVAVLGEGGIGYQHFSEVFGRQGLAFYAPLAKALTGMTPEGSNPKAPAPVVKLKVSIVGAKNLRDADLAGESDPYCICEVVGRPAGRIQTKVINDNLHPVWNFRGELADFSPGEDLRFSVFDKDIGVASVDECLGQAKLLSPQFLPNGFEGELLLADPGSSGKDESQPVLKVKVAAPSAALRRHSQLGSIALEGAAAQPAAEAAAAADARHEELARELRRLLPDLPEEASAWYRRAFEALCGHDHLLRRDAVIGAAKRLFGVPSGVLAGRLFEILDADGRKEVDVLTWGLVLERFHAGHSAEKNYQKVALAFTLFDLDGDGLISAEDAGRLAQEVERLEAMPAEPKPEAGAAGLCEEMRWIYGLIADRMSANQVFGGGSSLIFDHWMFHQLRPHPVLADALLERLHRLAGPAPVAAPSAPPPAASAPLAALLATPMAPAPALAAAAAGVGGRAEDAGT